MIKPEWVGLRTDLASVHCSLAPQSPTPADKNIAAPGDRVCGLSIWEPQIDVDRVAKYAALAAISGSKLYDQELYRLLAVNGFPGDLEVCFTLDSYFRYRHGVGLLVEELTFALIENNLNVESVLRRSADSLPLRQYFLPNTSRFEDYDSRVCAGGVAVTFAMARAEGDFVIPVQVRSQQVDGGQGLRSVMPMAYHQPMTDAEKEIDLESTVFREVFEEVFGGEEAGQNVKRIKHDWYFDKDAGTGRPISPALYWIKKNRPSVTVRCTGFDLNLLYGTYDFGILLVVHDPAFWRKFEAEVVTNWEIKKAKKVTTASSKELSSLTNMIECDPWAGQGLMSLVEGVTLLKELEPKRVAELQFQRLRE